MPLAATAVRDHLKVPYAPLSGANITCKFSRARFSRDLTAPISPSTARATSSSERPSYSKSKSASRWQKCSKRSGPARGSGPGTPRIEARLQSPRRWGRTASRKVPMPSGEPRHRYSAEAEFAMAESSSFSTGCSDRVNVEPGHGPLPTLDRLDSGATDEMPAQAKSLPRGGHAEGDVTTRALPTTSISESPGIHSTAMHAREGARPALKYVP
jgi:hypothetical protein